MSKIKLLFNCFNFNFKLERTKQTERVKTSVFVLPNFFIETVWLPRVCPKWDGNRLSKVIQLKSTASHGIHDASVVDNLNRYTGCSRSENKVSVGGCSKGVTHYEECYVACLSCLQHFCGPLLHCFTISYFYRLPIIILL
jgi:hypothetical protein